MSPGQTYLGIRGGGRTKLGERRVVVKEDIVLYAGSRADVFEVKGGPVLLLAMFMEITETVSNNACNMSWVLDPDNGSDTDIGADVNIQAADAGDCFWAELDCTAIEKTETGTLIPSLAVDRGSANGRGLVCFPGGIDLDLSSAAMTSGKGTIYIIYEPLVDGALIGGGASTASLQSSTTTSTTTSTTSSTSSSTTTTSSTTTAP